MSSACPQARARVRARCTPHPAPRTPLPRVPLRCLPGKAHSCNLASECGKPSVPGPRRFPVLLTASPRSSQRSTLSPAATGWPSRETEAGSSTSTAGGVLVPLAGAESGGTGGNCVDPSPSPQPPLHQTGAFLSEALCEPPGAQQRARGREKVRPGAGGRVSSETGGRSGVGDPQSSPQHLGLKLNPYT